LNSELPTNEQEALDGRISELAASIAEHQLDDRTRELTGAVRLVTSLAAVDGAVLMTPMLEVLGFGVKIRSTHVSKSVYLGGALQTRRTNAPLIPLSNFGMRHRSILSYCCADADAIGVVVSQDGNVRLIMTVDSKLAMWHDIQLLAHDTDLVGYVRHGERGRRFRKRQRSKGQQQAVGYGPMPKTLDDLLADVRNENRLPVLSSRDRRRPVRTRERRRHK